MTATRDRSSLALRAVAGYIIPAKSAKFTEQFHPESRTESMPMVSTLTFDLEHLLIYLKKKRP